jgi:cell fate regulator YaaT (PSP1 superfamily)
MGDFLAAAVSLVDWIHRCVSHQYFVRVGLLGQVGRFAPADFAAYRRGARVVCRTARGIEAGEVLSEANSETPGDGDILRRVTIEDDLLLERLQRNRDEAFEACTQLLAERGVPAVLMDVEHLLDGGSIYFYFLGEPPAEAESLVAELAEAYETKIQFHRFAETLTEGCGPGCGTEEAQNGCGATCGACAVASACATKNGI